MGGGVGEDLSLTMYFFTDRPAQFTLLNHLHYTVTKSPFTSLEITMGQDKIYGWSAQSLQSFTSDQSDSLVLYIYISISLSVLNCLPLVRLCAPDVHDFLNVFYVCRMFPSPSSLDVPFSSQFPVPVPVISIPVIFCSFYNYIL